MLKENNKTGKSRFLLVALTLLLLLPADTAFAQNGSWISEQEFVNTWSDYVITFPVGYTNESYHKRYQADLQDFSICSPQGDMWFQVVYKDLGKEVDSQELSRFSREFESVLLAEGGYTFGQCSYVTLGGHDFVRMEFLVGDLMAEDVYIRPVGNQVMIMDVLYLKSQKQAVTEILEAQKVPGR